ncbi:coiled-coil domain-containing protein 148-like [Symsagittifera roscoffensis]|uniref:coiled-coil domain-containing protein 148-like n=1 Tax=Symsagittifera roscoffensis TaxID=84072 RepID=UPI00307BE56E
MGSIGGLRENLNKGAKIPFVTTAAPSRDMETAERLVKRFTNGMSSNRYFENDYQNFEALKHEINRRGNRQMEKMRQIERARKQNRDINSLKQHKLAWRNYYERLCRNASRLEEEIWNEMYESADKAEWCESGEESAFAELVEYKKLVGEDTRELRQDMLANVSELRNEIDLLFYEQSGVEDEKFEILQLKLEGLKEMMEVMDSELVEEVTHLEVDLMWLTEFEGDSGLKHANPSHEFEGVPLDLLVADFPRDNLWSSLMAEVVLMDENFKQRLRELDVEYLHIIRNVNNDWYIEDSMLFDMIREQYQAHEVQNSYTLFLDRLKRHFPKANQEYLLAHDRWCREKKAYIWKKCGILKTWQQTKQQLVLKVTALLTEASHKSDEMQKLNLEKEAQMKYCRHLMDKVNAWKEAKAEEARLEDELAALQAQRERLKTDEKLKREKSTRMQQKHEIQHFRNAKKLMSEEAERMKVMKLREIQEQLANQAALDQERIEYRKKEREKKLERMAAQNKRREEEKERVERKLEELRSQVRVEAQRDPERTVQPTVASDARFAHLNGGAHSETAYEPLNAQLFSVNTFNNKQLKKDNRVQVENALRQAGLLHTDYARSVIQSMQPPKPPRKDTFSNIKFTQDGVI